LFTTQTDISPFRAKTPVGSQNNKQQAYHPPKKERRSNKNMLRSGLSKASMPRNPRLAAFLAIADPGGASRCRITLSMK